MILNVFLQIRSRSLNLQSSKWWMQFSWLEHQIVILRVVGSSPIIHPKNKASLRGFFFLLSFQKAELTWLSSQQSFSLFNVVYRSHLLQRNSRMNKKPGAMLLTIGTSTFIKSGTVFIHSLLVDSYLYKIAVRVIDYRRRRCLICQHNIIITLCVYA